MKKKPVNNLIKLQVHIVNTDKVFGFRVGIHTYIKEIEHLISNELCLDLLRTNLELTHSSQAGRLNSGKTLYQYGIKNNMEYMYCKYQNIMGGKLATNKKDIRKQVNGLIGTLDLTYKHPIKLSGLVKGINVEAICVNKICLNYNRGIVFPLGLGEFNMLDIMKGYPCTTCPYRDLNVFTPSLTKQIKFKQCMFTIKGKVKSKNGFPSIHDIGCWVAVQEEDSTFLQKIIETHDWTEAQLIVKNIIPEKSNPFATYKQE